MLSYRLIQKTLFFNITSLQWTIGHLSMLSQKSPAARAENSFSWIGN